LTDKRPQVKWSESKSRGAVLSSLHVAKFQKSFV